MVKTDETRVAVSLSWDPGANADDLVTLKATNPADGSVSTRDGLKNDGLAVFTFPSGYHGEAHFEVLGSDGERIDDGVITV